MTLVFYVLPGTSSGGPITLPASLQIRLQHFRALGACGIASYLASPFVPNSSVGALRPTPWILLAPSVKTADLHGRCN